MAISERKEREAIRRIGAEPLYFRRWDKRLVTRGMILAAVRADGLNLKYVRHNRRDAEICRIAVENDGSALHFVPEELRTAEFCGWAVRERGASLADVPESLRTPELCRAAVEGNGLAFHFVPEHLRTKSLCDAAVRAGRFRLLDIPRELLTSEICLAAVKSDPEQCRDVPKELYTPEIALAALETDPEFCHLWNVPFRCRTKEVCLAALRVSFLSPDDFINYVPGAARSKEFFAEAVKINGQLLSYAREKTPEMCLDAVRQDGYALSEVPEDLATEEIYVAAVRERGNSLLHVPERARSREICLEAVRQDGQALRHVPQNLQDDEICRVAVSQCGLALVSVPEKSRELCLMAVRQDGSAWRYVPEQFRDREMMLEALRNDAKGEVMRDEDIPDELVTRKNCAAFIRAVLEDAEGGLLKRLPTVLLSRRLCLAILAKFPHAVARLTDDFLNSEICYAAVKSAPEAFLDIPKEYRYGQKDAKSFCRKMLKYFAKFGEFPLKPKPRPTKEERRLALFGKMLALTAECPAAGES